MVNDGELTATFILKNAWAYTEFNNSHTPPYLSPTIYQLLPTTFSDRDYVSVALAHPVLRDIRPSLAKVALAHPVLRDIRPSLAKVTLAHPVLRDMAVRGQTRDRTKRNVTMSLIPVHMRASH